MKKIIFIAILTAFSISSFADVFDELDKEVALIEKFCADDVGRMSEELITNRNNKTGELISEKLVNVVYCKDGSRHVVEKSNNRNKSPKNTVNVLDGLNKKASSEKHTCTFENSFLIGTCNGNQYFYDEELSSIKRKDLAKFYKFVKKSSPSMVSDNCKNFKNNNKKFIICNDFGIILEIDDTFPASRYRERKIIKD